METGFFIVAMLAAGFWVSAGILLGSHRNSLKLLEEIPVNNAHSLPKVSVVIPARNEERNLQQALQSVLALDYPELEILVVNDRSTDGTGQILKEMAQTDPRLQVQTLTDLPESWLGKTYALHSGAQAVTWEYILFTDADVVFQPLALRKAIQYAQERKLDHLTVVPKDTMPGFFLRVVAATFGLFMFLLFQPWKARDPRSRKYMGIGAFNLVRTSVYRAIGGHQAIALRPDDDLKLGKLVKKNGYRQDVLNGKGMIAVEWYRSVPELIEGLMKNMFAGMEYSVLLVILATIGSLFFHIWPWIGLWVTTGWVQILNGVAVIMMVGTFAYAMAPFGVKPWHGLLLPVTVMLFLYIQWRATILTLWNGGITWRGTRYPLDKLKANKV